MNGMNPVGRDLRAARETTVPSHWIPFTEDEVGCTSAFASHFMSDFLR
jgi:hypothetical protein